MYKGGSYSSVPAYTLGPKTKAIDWKHVPGPGSYDLPSSFGWKTDSKWTFGKGQKRNVDNGVPGPGAYDSQSTLRGRKGALDVKPRFDPFDTFVPGPGAYEKNSGASTKFSFGKQPRVTPVKQAGPDYKIPSSIPDVAGYNYPSESRRKIHL